MSILTFDWETQTFSSGNPFDLRNFGVCLGYQFDGTHSVCLFDQFNDVQEHIDNAEILVGFNLKFDLHWLRKYGIKFAHKRMWDCQIAEFLLSGQTNRFPSLEETATKYGFGHKLDIVKSEYWEKGINTDQIPPDILSDYCIQDVHLTYQIYLKQLEQFLQKPQLFKLFKLQCQDLLVLEEMEWNGLLYNKELCEERSVELSAEISKIQTQLALVYPDFSFLNFNSGDNLSAFLYGGMVYEEGKELIGTYKTGLKAGQSKYKNIIIEHQLPKLIEPLKGTKLKKDGYFKTDENTLRKLKGPAAKKFVAPLLRLAELQKLVGTYYDGLSKLAEEMHWEENMIHGQFHQVVAQTGRLSSSQPNQQNFAGECEDVFVSRYND